MKCLHSVLKYNSYSTKSVFIWFLISTIFDQQLIALTCSSLEQFNVSTLALKRAYMFHDTKEISYVIVTLIWYIRYSLHFLGTGKSLWEALILASTKPKYDKRLFIELRGEYMKIYVNNMFWACSEQSLFFCHIVG